jgi:hypothetical protein
MLWSPTGPAVVAGVSPANAAFRAAGNIAANYGGVAWVFNSGTGVATFTLGGSGVTNTLLIPIGGGQGMTVAFGPGDTHISASSADISTTPGIGRP